MITLMLHKEGTVPDRTRMLPLVCLTALVTAACGSGSAESDGANRIPEPAIEWAPATYVVYQAGTALTIDGVLDEPAWRAAQWTDDFVDIEGAAKPTPRYRTRAKMLWDNTYFYVGADLEEPHIWGTLTTRDAVIYRDNDFEVFIDPDGDTHEYYELEINALGTEWDLFLVKPYRDGGPALNAWDIQGLLTAINIEGTLNQADDIDAKWSVEIAIPWSVLAEAAHQPAPPEPGEQWRVNFSRVEWQIDIVDSVYVKRTDPTTGEPLPEDNWVWSPQGLINMHYPEMWGTVQFSRRVAGPGRDPFIPSSVEDAKWVLRQIYYRERSWRARRGHYTDNLLVLDIGDPRLANYRWPPRINHTDDQFEAILRGDDGSELVINHEGRVWER